ncbi:unnamed protein product [Cochlearia groenlandica]
MEGQGEELTAAKTGSVQCEELTAAKTGSVQCEELMAAKTGSVDLDMCFEPQSDEAVAAPETNYMNDLDGNPSFWKPDIKIVKLDLDMRLHNKMFTKDETWIRGACSSSSLTENAEIRLYFKGLVSEETIKDTSMQIGGFGVAICDGSDNQLLSRNDILRVKDHEESSQQQQEVAELSALIHGFDVVIGASLGNGHLLLCRFKRLEIHVPYNMKFEVPRCLHRFCLNCMKNHVTTTIQQGGTANCPQWKCESNIEIEDCKAFLEPPELAVMIQRKRESAIAYPDRVYCPSPPCSFLMSRHELLAYTTKSYFLDAEESGARKCMKCGFCFCINCDMGWHYNMSCETFRKTEAYKTSAEAEFEDAFEMNNWRKCKQCNSLMDHVGGCKHVICEWCKHEFCYTCGSEWIDQKATCNCPPY